MLRENPTSAVLPSISGHDSLSPMVLHHVSTATPAFGGLSGHHIYRRPRRSRVRNGLYWSVPDASYFFSLSSYRSKWVGMRLIGFATSASVTHVRTCLIYLFACGHRDITASPTTFWARLLGHLVLAFAGRTIYQKQYIRHESTS